MNQDKDLSTPYEDAVRELYYFLKSPGSNFHSFLYDLIGRADRNNRRKIQVGFPFEVRAWEMWQDSENEKKFFETWLKNKKRIEVC